MNRALVLVGLPGSGKTTIGSHAAQRLGTAFTDIDAVVAQAAGKSIADIFAEEGEAAFRRLERAAMAGALAAPPHVIAPGAGWAAQPGNLETAGGALIVYLQVAPDVAAGRIRSDASRPLFAGREVGTAMIELLAEREPAYLRAEARLDAAKNPEVVVTELVALLRRPRAAGGRL